MIESRRRKYLRLFRDELVEHLRVVTDSLLVLEDSWDERAMNELVRRLHTIKGSAYMVELNTVGDEAHRLEDQLKAISSQERPLCRDLLDQCFAACDTFSHSTEAAVREVSVSADAAPGEHEARVPETSPLARKERRAERRSEQMTEGAVRVDIHRLDHLVDLVGELLILKSRIDHRHRWLRSLISRGLEKVEGRMVVDDFTEDLVELGYLVDDLRHRTMEVRMLPVASVLDDFYRTVRSLSRELRKEVRFEVSGRDVEVDKRLLDALRPLLIHLVRNAVDHGIEHPDERRRAGKSEEGTIRLEISSDGRVVTFRISDDGRGIDLDRIRRRAVECGFLSAECAGEVERQTLLGFVFEPGFSTASSVTEVSGRGVGMDVVKRGVEELKGTLDVDTEPGRGTSLEFTLPMTLSVIHVLLVEENGATYALPLSSVVETLRVRWSDIVPWGRGDGLVVNDNVLPLVRLSDLLGFSHDDCPSSGRMSGVVVRRRGERLVVLVDHIAGDGEIVVKSLGTHIKAVRYVVGATIGKGGVPSLIINVNDLFESEALVQARRRYAGRGDLRARRILVVDDSFTTRTMERNILESAGYLVDTAASGEEALEKATKDDSFDVILCDIEMPGIDGAEVTRRLREHPVCRETPIVIVSSSRSTEAWRACQDAGANALLAKQDFHQGRLMALVEELSHGDRAESPHDEFS